MAYITVKNGFIKGKMAMRNYKILSRLILAACLIGVALAIINYFTGFINAGIQISGTIVCIAGFIIAAIATAIS